MQVSATHYEYPTPLTTAIAARNVSLAQLLLQQEGIKLPSLRPALSSHNLKIITLLVAAGAHEGGHVRTHSGIEHPEEILELMAKTGENVAYITRSLVSYLYCEMDHMEHCHYPTTEVVNKIQILGKGYFFKPNLKDFCRIVIRKKLILVSRGCSILPAIQKLPLPSKTKSFLALDCALE